MADEFIKDINYGALNRVDGLYFNSKARFDNVSDNAVKAIADTLKNRASKNVLVNNTEFIAFCLKVVDVSENDVASLMSSMIPSLAIDNPGQIQKIIKVYGRIPEIHTGFPIPISNDDDDAIDAYPVFVGNAQPPTPGSLIRVTFKDVQNQEGGLYLGPVFDGNSNPLPSSLTEENNQQTNTVYRNSEDNSRDDRGNATEFPLNMPNINFNNLYNNNKEYFDTFYAKSISRNFNKIFNRRIVFPEMNQVSNDEHKRSYICAAVAEVIEQYWKQIYPDAFIEIKSHTRLPTADDSNNNHSSSSAIDFVVWINNKQVMIPALQCWASVKKLMDAGRIPYGGFGLYLNVSSNGIKSANPNDAGRGSSRYNPPGGSAATHYDFRGNFGPWWQLRPNPRSRPRMHYFDYWICLDTDGRSAGQNGTDEFKTSQQTPNTAILAKLSELGLDSVSNYIKKIVNSQFVISAGNVDEFLPSVSSTVQNVMQVLKL